MLDNLNLKKKLIIALLVPIIGLIYFTYEAGMANLNEQNKIIHLKTFLDDTIYVSDLIHELQKERGATTGFIGSKGKNFILTLKIQRELTDKKIKALLKHIKIEKIDNQFGLVNLFTDLNKIKIIRKRVDLEKISFDEVFDYYSNINEKFLNFISNFLMISNNNEMSQVGIAYINILKAREASGKERAILNNVFTSGKMEYKTIRKFSVLYSSHQAYINNYKSLINKKQLSNFNKKMLDKSVIEVERLREIAFSKISKDKIISNIKEIAGYGGLIHDFKNYVLRGDEKYAKEFINDYKLLQVYFYQYRNLHTINEDEKILINIISNTFTKYYNGLKDVVKAYHNKGTIKELDKIVKVDDIPAIEAINTLDNNILGADGSLWYKVSTKRIDILKDIETDLVNDMLNKMDTIIDKIKNKLILNFLIFMFIVIFILVLSIKIINDITTSIEKFKDGLMNFFNYLTNNTESVEPILINTNDEIGQMAVVVNDNIKKTKLFLDEKVENEILKNKEKDELIFQQSKMASMGEMIGNIAHQWRQPLSAISTSASSMIVQKNVGLLTDENLYSSCESIINSTSYLSHTIDDFRDFLKGSKSANKFDLQSNINKNIEIIRGIIKNSHIRLILDIDKKIEIENIENELTQAFINIVNNAKDALNDKNKDGMEKLVFISTQIDDDYVVLTIKDNAGGIPTDIIDKIFEPYFTTKHQSQGTGLGLYMTHQIITDSMDGKIFVKNVKYSYEDVNYKGAEFKIYLKLLSK